MPKCLSKFNTLHFAQFMSQVIMGNSMSKKINNACEKHQKIFRSPKYLCSIYMCFRFIQLLLTKWPRLLDKNVFWLFEHNLQNVLSKPSTQSEYKFKGEEALNLICNLSTLAESSHDVKYWNVNYHIKCLSIYHCNEKMKYKHWCFQISKIVSQKNHLGILIHILSRKNLFEMYSRLLRRNNDLKINNFYDEHLMW